MTEKIMTLALVFIMGLIGGFLVVYYGNWQLFVGIFLLMWGNNIGHNARTRELLDEDK